MPDEPNVPTHRYYQKQNHVRLPKSMMTKRLILAEGIAIIDGGITGIPVLFGTSFDDATDTATFSTTETGTLVWATSLQSETLVPAPLAESWEEGGVLLEEGTVLVATLSGNTLEAPYTATTGTGGEARKFSYYLVDDDGNASNVIEENFTVGP